jgi:hypothetical protein
MATLPEAPADRPMTKRERLAQHRENAVCAACHDVMDPPGLALEHYDAIGAYRSHEGGLPIDASGELDGVRFTDARGLVEALARNPALGECLVRKIYRVGTGRSGDPTEDAWARRLGAEHERSGGKLVPLLAAFARSEAFTHVSAPPAP